MCSWPVAANACQKMDTCCVSDRELSAQANEKLCRAFVSSGVIVRSARGSALGAVGNTTWPLRVASRLLPLGTLPAQGSWNRVVLSVVLPESDPVGVIVSVALPE